MLLRRWRAGWSGRIRRVGGGRRPMGRSCVRLLGTYVSAVLGGRCRQVGRDLQARGIRFVFRNEILTSTQFRPGEVDCLLVNTTGELKYFYEHATVIFVGKSLTAEGGQNPIEAGALGFSTSRTSMPASLFWSDRCSSSRAAFT